MLISLCNSDDPHDRKRFERRVSVNFEGRTVWMPTAEDVVITKLRWSRQGKELFERLLPESSAT
jgi:hypothetical protein